MRVGKILLWALVTAALIVSFVFSVLALKSPRWVSADLYEQIPITSNSAQAGQYVYAATNLRGPYHFLNYTITTDPSDGSSTMTSTVNAGHICYPNVLSGSDLPWFCQQLTIGVKTLIAGSALTGIAMISAALATIATIVVARGSFVEVVFQRLVLLTGVLGALGEGIGGLVVANTLVNQQAPDGDYISSTTIDPTKSHWVIGKGVVFVTVACLPTIIALTLLPSAGATASKHHEDHAQHQNSNKRRHWRRGEKSVIETA